MFFLSMGALIGLTAMAAGATYYVDSDARDSGNGAQEKPFKTLQAAVAAAHAGDTVLAKGVFRETVTFPRDGAANAPITVSVRPGDRAVVSGCDVVSGWTVHSGKVLSASQPWSMGKGLDQVFVDGDVVIMARHPNTNTRELHRVGYSPLFPTRGTFNIDEANRNRSRVISSSDLNQPKGYWTGAIYNGRHHYAWAGQSAVVTNSGPGELLVGKCTGKWWFPFSADDCGRQPHAINSGYLTGHMNALDMAGEWHLESGVLYLWPKASDDLNRHTVEAKRRNLAFDLRGRAYINLRGLEVFGASLTAWKAHDIVLDHMLFSYVSHFQIWDDARDGYIDDATKQPTDGTGAPQSGRVGVFVGGESNRLVNSTIRYSAGAGLFLTGKGHVVSNNVIHDVGYAPTYLGGIHLSYEPGEIPTSSRGRHVIAHNSIYNVGRAAINLSHDEAHYPPKMDVWKAKPGDLQVTVYEAMDIGYNRLYNGALYSSDSNGGVYSWLVAYGTDSERGQIHHNLVWNSYDPFLHPLGHFYMDNGSFKADLHHNLTWWKNGTKKHKLLFCNPPNDCVEKDNRDKGQHDHGVFGLTPADYPGGYFASGADHGDVARGRALDRSGWKVFAHASYAADVAGKAIDGDMSTRWANGAGQSTGQWFKIDLGSAQRFDTLDLAYHVGGTSPQGELTNWPRGLDVFVSDTDGEWGRPVASASAGGRPDLAVTFPRQNKRWMKIELTVKTDYWWTIDEVYLSDSESK